MLLYHNIQVCDLYFWAIGTHWLHLPSSFFYQIKLGEVFKAVEGGELKLVKDNLDRKAMAFAKNKKGQSLLHVAVLKNHVNVANYLLEQFPATVHCKDNVSGFVCVSLILCIYYFVYMYMGVAVCMYLYLYWHVNVAKFFSLNFNTAF